MGDSHAAKFKGRMMEHASLKVEMVSEHVVREKHERLNLRLSGHMWRGAAPGVFHKEELA